MFNIFIQNELKLEKKCLCSIALKLFFHFRNNFSFNHKTFKKSLQYIETVVKTTNNRLKFQTFFFIPIFGGVQVCKNQVLARLSTLKVIQIVKEFANISTRIG